MTNTETFPLSQPVVFVPPRGYRVMTEAEIHAFREAIESGGVWESAGSIKGGVLWDNDGEHADNCRCNSCK